MTKNVFADITGFDVQGWNIVVQPLEPEEGITTQSGFKILLPEEIKDDIKYLSNVCKVLAVGPTAYTQEMFKGQPWCKVGDYILIPKNSGQKILWKKQVITVVACDRVIAVIDDPKNIDQSFNLSA